jgi:hypothetical protein
VIEIIENYQGDHLLMAFVSDTAHHHIANASKLDMNWLSSQLHSESLFHMIPNLFFWNGEVAYLGK